MADINLLQSNSSSIEPNSGFAGKIIAKLLGIALFLVIVAYVGILVFNWTSKKSLAKVQSDISSAQSQSLSSKDRNELVTRQEQLANLETLLDNHVYWSYLLPELARVTLKSAKYTDITATRNGQLDLTVVLPNYSEIEKYMQIFDLPEYNQQFSNVKIVSINNVQSDSNIETQVRLQLQFNPQYIKGRM